MDDQVPELSQERRIGLSRALAERHLRIANTRTEFYSSLKPALEKLGGSAEAFVGEDWNDYRRLRQTLGRSGGPDLATSPSVEEDSAQRKKRTAAVAKFMQQRGVTHDDLLARQRSGIRTVRTSAETFLNQDAFHSERKVISVGPPDPCIDKQWTHARSPYAGAWGTNWDWIGPADQSSHREDPITGEIGCATDLSYRALDGSSPILFAEAMSEVHTWYQVPVTGLLEVWLVLRAINVVASGSLVDESGFSNALLVQQSRGYVEVFDPPSGMQRFVDVFAVRRVEDEGEWARVIAGPGNTRAFYLLYNVGAYAAGQWILIATGVWDSTFMWLDDMSCYTQATSRWLVDHVSLRMT